MVLLCCLWCGKAKEGIYHEGGASGTSVDHCTAAEKHEGWVTPAGYDVGDQQKPLSNHQIKKLWLQCRKAMGICNDANYAKW